MLEIERKFLVTSDAFKEEAFAQNRIKQGYLSSVPERTVRVRVKGNKGYLTIKGISNDSGMSRFEWEKEIPVTEAKELLLLCEKGVIDKTRFEVKQGNHVFEIDEFYGENEGLIVAEIELGSETESFEKPSWLGKAAIVTCIPPLPLLEAISINARFERSISLDLTNGPLSVISTITDFPFFSLVTFTFVPKGSFLCAAVYLLLSNFLPLVVRLPLNLSA